MKPHRSIRPYASGVSQPYFSAPKGFQYDFAYNQYERDGALQALRNTAPDLATTSQTSTGLRASSTADSSAYWNITTTTASDGDGLAAAKDAIGLSAAVVDSAQIDLTDAAGVVQQIRDKLVSAKQPGADRDQMQAEIGPLQSRLQTIADDSSFGGKNLLKADLSNGPTTENIVSSLSRAGSSVSVVTSALSLNSSTVLVDTSNTGGTSAAGGILDAAAKQGVRNSSLLTLDISDLDAYKQDDTGLVSSGASDDDVLDAMLAQVDKQLAALNSAASSMSTTSTGLDSQQSFAQSLIDANSRSGGALVDADMEEEAARLKAQQTQQQMTVQSLNITSSNAGNVTSLFR